MVMAGKGGMYIPALHESGEKSGVQETGTLVFLPDTGYDRTGYEGLTIFKERDMEE
jgi:hypothetical protein